MCSPVNTQQVELSVSIVIANTFTGLLMNVQKSKENYTKCYMQNTETKTTEHLSINNNNNISFLTLFSIQILHITHSSFLDCQYYVMTLCVRMLASKMEIYIYCRQ